MNDNQPEDERPITLAGPLDELGLHRMLWIGRPVWACY